MGRGIIYLISNKENGYKYIGQTNLAMNKIWQHHIKESLQMSSKPLHRAMRKYGNHRFNIQEIDECDESLLNEREEYWIKHLNTHENGYNTINKDKIVTPPKKQDLPTIKSPTKEKSDPWGSLTEKNRGNGKHCGLKIRGKNLETGICTDYENARMAALSLTGDANKNSNILLAARKNGTAYGHKWQLLEEKSKKKSIFGVNKKTGLIGPRHESIADAVRSICPGVSTTGIVKSLRNPGKFSWKNYYWFYG